MTKETSRVSAYQSRDVIAPMEATHLADLAVGYRKDQTEIAARGQVERAEA